MKILFQTGTPITAENLNLAQLATSKPGVLSGCDIYESDEYLVASQGCVQFSDGAIVYLDGTDRVKFDTLAHNEYYAYIVRYGNDFAFEVSMMLPEYEHIVLADIIITDNSIKIVNSKKSTSLNSELIIDGSSLHPNFLVYDETAFVATFSKDFTKLTTFLRIQVNNESYLGIPFTYPNFLATKIRLKAKLSSDTSLKLSLYQNGASVYTNDGIITQNDFNENDECVFDLQDATKNLKSGDICSIKLLLGQSTSEENGNSDIDIYSITLQT